MKTIPHISSASTFILLALSSLLISSTASADLIVNGSFEAPVISGVQLERTAGDSSITGWTVEGTHPTDGGVTLIRGWFGIVASDGIQVLSLQSNSFNNGKAGIISQSFATDIGQLYNLSFDYSALDSADPGRDTTITYDVGAADQTVTFATDQTPWATQTFPFTASATSTTLTFEGDLLGQWNGPLLDNISVVAIPEPSILALLGAGAVMLLAARRRSPRKSFPYPSNGR